MEEKIILIKIIKLLLERKDLLLVQDLSKKINSIKEEYPNIDWHFLDNINMKNESEIVEWLNYIMNEVYI